MSTPATDATGILVRAKIFPLAFILLLFKINVWIDGIPSLQSWGDTFFPVPPGQHEVRVSFRYIFFSNLGENTMSVNVVPGQTTLVHYRSRWIVFLKGTMKVEGAPAG